MLKFLIGFERRDGLTRNECQNYLANTHGPLVASVPEFCKHARGYVQNFAFDAGIADHIGFNVDGAAELWFDDMPTFVAAYSEPRYLELVRPDEPRFANPERMIAAFTKEQVVSEKRLPGTVKLFRFLESAEGVGPTNFQTEWKHAYADRLVSDEALHTLVVRYLHNWSVPIDQTPFPLARTFAGVDQLWFESESHLHIFLELEQRILQRISVERSVRLAACIAFAATEKTVLPMSGS